MSEVAGEQHEVMSDRSGGPAPLGDQAGGERMPEIVQTRPGPRPVAFEVARQKAEGGIQDTVTQRSPARSDEEAFGEGPSTAPLILIARQCPGRRGVQRQ